MFSVSFSVVEADGYGAIVNGQWNGMVGMLVKQVLN